VSRCRVAAITVLLSLFVLLVTGCNDSAPAPSVPTSIAGPVPIRTSDPVTSRWPVGLAAAVVDKAGQLTIVDQEGVVFREADAPATVMGRDEDSATFSFALSNNGEYIAYLRSRDKLIVRRVATGQAVGSVTVVSANEMIVAAVSDDASRVVLISNDSDPAQYHDRFLPQTVTLCAVADGSTAVSASLSDYVTEAAHHIYKGDVQPVLMNFLPDGRIIVYRRFGTVETSNNTTTVYSGVQDTSVYEPGKDRLKAVEGLTKAWAASATGVVVGAKQTHLSTPWSNAYSVGGSQEMVTPVVWVKGKLQSLEMENLVFQEGVPYWPSAISRGGRSVAVVVGGNLPDTLWWQVFQPSDGKWRPVGVRCETPVTWIQMNPVAVSDDGSTIWGLRSDAAGTGGGTRQYPISVDTATGKWAYWFQTKDLEVPAEDFDVVALILR
jgi:hypothetical protein